MYYLVLSLGLLKCVVAAVVPFLSVWSHPFLLTAFPGSGFGTSNVPISKCGPFC